MATTAEAEVAASMVAVAEADDSWAQSVAFVAAQVAPKMEVVAVAVVMVLDYF